MLHITLLASVLTGLVTTIISVLLTLLIVTCVYCSIKRKPLPLAPSNPQAAGVCTPPTNREVPEYVIPRTNPSTNAQHSLVVSDSLSMQFNRSYTKMKTKQMPSAPEYPNRTAPMIPHRSPLSLSRSCPEVPALLQARDRQHHSIRVD